MLPAPARRDSEVDPEACSRVAADVATGADLHPGEVTGVDSHRMRPRLEEDRRSIPAVSRSRQAPSQCRSRVLQAVKTDGWRIRFWPEFRR